MINTRGNNQRETEHAIVMQISILGAANHMQNFKIIKTISSLEQLNISS